MPGPDPEKLWASVVGDTEPWRKGRMLLVILAILHALVHLLLTAGLLIAGTIENALGFVFGITIWWLLFAFVWLGTHWVRWLLGAYTMLLGFAQVIWGIRDGMMGIVAAGVVNFMIGACLFAPSVHFFAVRQRSEIRWLEKIIVGATFFILLASVLVAVVGLNLYRVAVQREAERYGHLALQRIFTENDTGFLLGAATDEWRGRGDLAITNPMTDKFLRLGNVENIRVLHTELRSFYIFPLTMNYAGAVEAEGGANCGAVRLRLELCRVHHDWRITAFRWLCP